MIDIDHQISSVRRQVGTRVLEAGEARVITVSQTYAADLEDVWDACTTAERIPRWFLPVSGDLRAGGRYQLEGNAGGVIERCDPPKSFAATWEYGGDVSWIELHLTPAAGGGTRFELEHIAHVDDERWTEFGPGAVGIGWEMGLVGLSLHLAATAKGAPEGSGVAEPAIELGAAWAASGEGRRFMTLSSERWRDADIASGTDETAARAAAGRVIAAYTGAAPEAPTAD